MISVIIPVYNREKTICDSVRSVLNQTIQDFEIIIVDDCSTDSTREKVLSLNDSRIRYFKTAKNSGAGGARNEGIRRAKGDFIAFHDSDDIMHSDKLERDYNFLQKGQYDVVYSQLERFNLYGESLGIQPVNCHNCVDIKETYEYFLWEGRIWTQTLFAKRRCFDGLFFDEKMCCNEDWEISLRLAKKYKIGFLNKSLTNVYIQENSISTNEYKALESYEYLFEKYNSDICLDSKMKNHWKDRILFTKWSLNEAEKKECIKAFIYTKDIKWVLRAFISIRGFKKIRELIKKFSK